MSEGRKWEWDDCTEYFHLYFLLCQPSRRWTIIYHMTYDGKYRSLLFSTPLWSFPHFVHSWNYQPFHSIHTSSLGSLRQEVLQLQLSAKASLKGNSPDMWSPASASCPTHGLFKSAAPDYTVCSKLSSHSHAWELMCHFFTTCTKVFKPVPDHGACVLTAWLTAAASLWLTELWLQNNFSSKFLETSSCMSRLDTKS